MVKIQAQTMLPATPQRTALARWAEPTPTMAPVMVCVVDTGMPRAVARNKRDRTTGFGAEAAHGFELGDLLAHGLDDAPAAKHGASRNGDVAATMTQPGATCRSGGVAGGDQQHPDDANGLLRVVAAVAQAVGAGRDQLQAPEPAVHPRRRGAAEHPGHQHHHQRAQQEAQHRRHKDEGHRLDDAGRSGHPSPALAITAPTMPPISACDELLGMP
jgi:hypothetical protein